MPLAVQQFQCKEQVYYAGNIQKCSPGYHP